MAGRLRKPPVMGGFFQRRENEVEIDNKINLGFSGGGFRATFYCLGAYRRLVELGLEKHVNEITSVSGGSITAGAVISALAEGDFSSLLDFDRRVTTKLINLGQCNFRRRIMTKASWLAYLLPYLPKLQQLALAAALRPKMSKAFPQVLDEELFEGRKMKQAEAATEWSCNATCINTLKRFRFKSSDIYGYLLGRSSDIDDIPIAFAVAASAAYPVGFAPLELDVEAREFRDLYGTGTQKPENPAKLYLTDGGVYDNLGSESMLKSPVPLLMLDASGASQPLWDNSHMSKLELANRTLAVGETASAAYFRSWARKDYRILARAWNQGNEYRTAIAGGTAVCCTEDRYGRLPRCRDRVSDVAGSGKNRLCFKIAAARQ